MLRLSALWIRCASTSSLTRMNWVTIWGEFEEGRGLTIAPSAIVHTTPTERRSLFDYPPVVCCVQDHLLVRFAMGPFDVGDVFFLLEA